MLNHRIISEATSVYITLIDIDSLPSRDRNIYPQSSGWKGGNLSTVLFRISVKMATTISETDDSFGKRSYSYSTKNPPH
jgi:hypothetical protein